MKKAETVTDDRGNIYIIPGQMTREEAEVYFPNQPERSKREDYPDGSIWKDSSSFNKKDEKYDFYGRLHDEWKFLGRFDHFIDVTWDRCGALNMMETS